MDLARELGMTLQQLEENLGPGELQYWLAYFSRRIFTWDASWLQYGGVTRSLATIFAAKNQRPPSIQDIIPDMSLGGP